MNIKIIFVSLLTLYLWGCSDDSPTAPEPTLPEPTLNTTARKYTGTFPIQEWDGSRWIRSGQKLSLETTWRFVSSVEVDTGLRVSGGYNIKFTNPTDRSVEFNINLLQFFDLVDINLAEYNISPDDDFSIEPSAEKTRTGTFEITVASLEVTELITRMGIFGSAGFIP